jgi:hypothetical protein
MLPETVLTDGTKEEFEALVETVGRNSFIKVQAPTGGHDDRYSAISRAIYMAEENADSQTLLASVGTEGSVGVAGKKVSSLSYDISEDGKTMADVLREVDFTPVKVEKFKFNK